MIASWSELDETKGVLEIQVIDSGIGITVEYEQDLFEKFSQQDKSMLVFGIVI